MKIYNSTSGMLEEFKTIKKDSVSMYVCGPTVYSDIHIGNARPIIFFDIVARYFKIRGNDVKFVSNITDIDDKIINKAEELEITEYELTSSTTREYLDILSKLNVQEYYFQPKVTDYISQIIDYISNLIKHGYAYEIHGNVYFRVGMSKCYGEISNVKLGNEISLNEESEKENSEDFVLWKKTTKGITFDSPFSKGRPGWHTECVAIIDDIFHDTIDIHGGGEDLKFPHHENENAQAEALGRRLSNYWMHNGFVNIDNQKMSKSIGNIFNVKDFLSEYNHNILRLLFCQCNYRQPINITNDLLLQIMKIYNKFDILYDTIEDKHIDSLVSNMYIDKVNEIMDNDFNLPNLLTYLFELSKLDSSREIECTYLYAFKILGLEFPVKLVQDMDSQLENLIALRSTAKSEKQYELADKFREEITKLGYEIEDTREGVIWKKI